MHLVAKIAKKEVPERVIDKYLSTRVVHKLVFEILFFL